MIYDFLTRFIHHTVMIVQRLDLPGYFRECAVSLDIANETNALTN
jgi:hypothetical protein